jgi:hypothetical protein
MCKEYNGYPNYETWAIKLWIDNEKSSQDAWQLEAESILDNAEAANGFTKIENAKLRLRDVLQSDHETQVEDTMPTLNWFAS